MMLKFEENCYIKVNLIWSNIKLHINDVSILTKKFVKMINLKHIG